MVFLKKPLEKCVDHKAHAARELEKRFDRVMLTDVLLELSRAYGRKIPAAGFALRSLAQSIEAEYEQEAASCLLRLSQERVN